MMAPRYQDIAPEDVFVLKLQKGGCVRVIAGDCEGRSGPVQGVVTAPLMMDCQLTENETFSTKIPAGHTAVAYVFSGGAVFGESADVMFAGHLVVFGDGESITVTGASDGGRLLLLAAALLGNPWCVMDPL